MNVRLLHFAVLRDIVGAGEERLEVPDGTRAVDVWNRLRQAHRQLAGYQRPPMTAINERYADPDELLHEGDELAFIPPVAGG
ncbi:MAG TPA: molybdopterin converting factor subunit 1 [Thermoanaerobaculia bacterium]|nr:molybdopterin converting factor subunit 1 [Thermoanaerobaculia bacterium]